MALKLVPTTSMDRWITKDASWQYVFAPMSHNKSCLNQSWLNLIGPVAACPLCCLNKTNLLSLRESDDPFYNTRDPECSQTRSQMPWLNVWRSYKHGDSSQVETKSNNIGSDIFWNRSKLGATLRPKCARGASKEPWRNRSRKTPCTAAKCNAVLNKMVEPHKDFGYHFGADGIFKGV